MPVLFVELPVADGISSPAVVVVSSCGETSGVSAVPVTPVPELEALGANMKSGYSKKSTPRIAAPIAIEPPMKIASDFAMPGAAEHSN